MQFQINFDNIQILGWEIMTEVDQHQLSVHTETRTQKSPQKIIQGINYYRGNQSSFANKSNLQIQYMKLREQSKKQIENYLKQINELKDQLFRKNEQVEHLKSTIIVNLKRDLNEAQRDNIKNFKQCQKQAREIEKLKTDNFRMQQDMEKNNKQRKIYFSKLDEVKQIKQTTRREILQKDKLIRTYAQQNKKLQKELTSYKLQNQDLIQQIKEKQKKLYESESQYKSVLEKSFIIESQLKTMQLRHRDAELMLNNYRQKLSELQRQREQLLERVDESQSRRSMHQMGPSVHQQTLGLEIKSLMEQIYNLLDDKKQQNKQIQKKFLASVACLQKTLKKP